LTSAALARDAAVPCRSLEVEAEMVERAEGDLTVDEAGLGLADDSLARAEAVVPVVRPSEELSRLSWALLLDGVRVLARDEAVGFEGVPVRCGFSGVGSGCMGCEDDVRRAGPVRAGVRRCAGAGEGLADSAGSAVFAVVGDLDVGEGFLALAVGRFTCIGDFGAGVAGLAEVLTRGRVEEADGAGPTAASLAAGEEVDTFGVFVGVEAVFACFAVVGVWMVPFFWAALPSTVSSFAAARGGEGLAGLAVGFA